jgi:DNA primase
MQDAKEEVRSRLNIEDVIGEYVQLKRAGRNFKGLSPFSGEKSPSFFVSPEKGIWHDFSSNKGGDVFSFVMEVEGVDFREALELLARRAGIEMSDYDSKGNQEFAKLKRRLLEAHRWASLYYQESLKQNDRALQYVFKKRGLSREIVQTFQIGYAPDSGDALVQFLLKKGFTKQELSDGGLTNRFGGDLFRGRMMVPLMDPSGQVIGFTGRILEDIPNAPKYLNTPQSPLYDKSRHVFGLSQAKEAIRKNDYAVVVEGNLDVVSSHQAGITQVVATAGTAMTESHLKSLVRLSPNARLAYDGDAAGLAATERSIPIAQNVGTELTIISLPEGVKDPDELIQQDVKLWQTAIDDAEGVVDWLLKQYTKRENMDIPLGKRRFTTAALNVVRTLQDPVEQEFYLKKIAGYTSTTLETVKKKFESRDDEPEPVLKEVKYSGESVADENGHEDSLLSLAFLYPAVREIIQEIDESMLSNNDRKTVLQYLKVSNETIQVTPVELQELDTYVKILLLKADARYGDWSDEDRFFETARLVRIIVTKHKQTQKDTLTAALRVAEDQGNDEEALQLRQALNELIKEIPRAKR